MMASQQTILIVDDEIINIKILVELLENDYEIMVAKNGREAIEIATSSHLPDLVLLDIVMPKMDGYQVCEKLKHNPNTQNIPVIFITGKTEACDEEKGLQVGAIDYISKPFCLAIVKMRVKNHLELKRNRDLLEQHATLDGLTGIANRRRFDQFLDQEWRRAMRLKTSLSLLLIDIDHFKLFNDHYGHCVGDDCLKLVSKTLSGALKRSSDLVARFGGEEFVCVLPQSSSEDAIEIAETIKTAVTALAVSHEPSPVAEVVTISIGVASVIPAIGSTAAEALIQAADKMLYKAKEKGRNQVVY